MTKIPDEIKSIFSGEKQLKKNDIPKIQDFIAGRMVAEGIIKDKSEIWDKPRKDLSKSDLLHKAFEEKHGRKAPRLTPQQIEKLEEAFFHGSNDSEAYSYAGVCKTDFYYWQEVNPEFAERKVQLQELIKLNSKMNVVKSIRDGNVLDSKFWLTTKCKEEFSTRTESTGKDGETLIPSEIIVTIVNDGKEE